MLSERASASASANGPVAAVPRVDLHPRRDPPVRIGPYDGPLDLLLILVRHEGVALREIPVARICDAYLAHLRKLDETAVDDGGIDIDRAGDFLAMAATLCLLKARELLPRAPGIVVDEDEDDPKLALEKRLIEYERFREAADALGSRELLDRNVFARPLDDLHPEETPIDPGVDSYGLAQIFYGLLDRAAAPPPVHRVEMEAYSLAESVRFVLEHLDDGSEHLLADVWLHIPFRRARVVTFLAVLEAARLQMLDVWQRIHLGAVMLTGKVKSHEADLSLLAGEDAPAPLPQPPPTAGAPDPES